MRIIKRAGLKPWAKLWQNLRSTRETKLADEFPAHVACAWIGNSEVVANKHYLQVTDEHFAQAVRNAVQCSAAGGRAESREQEPAGAEPRSRGRERNKATPCQGRGSRSMGQGGLEPPTSPLSGVRSSQLSY